MIKNIENMCDNVLIHRQISADHSGISDAELGLGGCPSCFDDSQHYVAHEQSVSSGSGNGSGSSPVSSPVCASCPKGYPYKAPHGGCCASEKSSDCVGCAAKKSSLEEWLIIGGAVAGAVLLLSVWLARKNIGAYVKKIRNRRRK